MKDDKSPDEEIEEAMSKAVEKVEHLALTDQRHIQLRMKTCGTGDLLLGILNSALLDYRYVQIGAKQKSPYLAAWSCRNLLELKVIATYVLASAENAKSFRE